MLNEVIYTKPLVFSGLIDQSYYELQCLVTEGSNTFI
jgi:hypothetical protein